MPRQVATTVLASTTLTSKLIFDPDFAPVTVTRRVVVQALAIDKRKRMSIPAAGTRIDLNMSIRNASTTVMRRRITHQSTTIIRLLQSHGMRGLRAAKIRLDPHCGCRGNHARLMNCGNDGAIDFQVPARTVKTLLSRTISMKTGRVHSVDFVTRSDILRSTHRRTLQQTITSTRARTAAILNDLGLDSRRVIDVRIGNTGPPVPIPLPQQTRFGVTTSTSAPIVNNRRAIGTDIALRVHC